MKRNFRLNIKDAPVTNSKQTVQTEEAHPLSRDFYIKLLLISLLNILKVLAHLVLAISGGFVSIHSKSREDR